jgi:D-lactate dehydrogenase
MQEKNNQKLKILFYDVKAYDKESLAAYLHVYPTLQMDFVESDMHETTAVLASGYDAVCVFVNAPMDRPVLNKLHKVGVRLILLRCAGYNNVDLIAAAELGMTVMRVPAYSPEAVAEHAMALALAVNRKLHKAYIKVRENNFSLVGLTGLDLYGKTAGIVGTGRIGLAMCRICRGFGMRVLAYDKVESAAAGALGVEYVGLDRLFSESDLLSLHCPLSDETYHMINEESIARMKKGVILVNTSRGALVDTQELIAGIRDYRFHGVGLDVYEEEDDNVFENREDDILLSSVVARLLSFPNVVVTSHQGFLTAEALDAIAQTTLQNAQSYAAGAPIPENVVSR